MAESLLLPLMRRLEAIVGEILGQELRQLAAIQEEAKKLKVTLQMIEGFLEDADLEQTNSRAVEDWLGALKEILYDAEDVLDDWDNRVSISQSQADDSGVTTEVSSYSPHFSCFQLLLSCLFCGSLQPASVAHGNDNIVHGLKNIVDRLDPLIHDKDLLNLVAYRKQDHNFPRPLTSSLVDVSRIYGRNSDKETIFSMLMGETSQQENQVHVPVISIVGMCGLGKTTLAQFIYNENGVKDFFDLRTWVCVSVPFDLQRVAMDIIEQAGGNAHQNFVSLETLLQRLCRSVQGKRFLLVLDDIWSEDPKDWTPLKLSLDAGAPGSRIVITTRNVRVAVMMGSIYTHMLGQLSDDDCWALFREIAYSGRSRENSEIFKDIGRDIARKCKGVPLSVKCIASSMLFMSTVQEWRNVVSGVWVPHMIGKSLLPALLLSYHGLSPYLKACFMYCAIFPGDVVIKKEELVKLWMAQGLLGLDEEKDLEMTGEKYFDELAMHSFFHDFQVNRDGKILTCRMHDLVHDFARFLTKSECSILKENETESRVTYFRHMNACNIESSSIFKLKNLRSLIFRVSEPTLLEVCSHLRVLRVLDLSYSDFKEMPSEIEWLPLLRYLDLSWNSSLTGLPEAMCTLYNLQTLKLIGCKSLCKLPKGVGKLSKLRHLEIQGTEEMNHFPQSIGKLRGLRTLCKFIVSNGLEGCRIGELGCLNDLRGTLKITRLRQVKNTNEARHAELLQKKHLSLLELDFGFSWDVSEDVTEEDMKRMEGVLGGLQPAVNLEVLVINDYPGFKFSFWMAKESLLPNLVTLELKECKNCILLPALGRLKSLEFLVIEGLESVKHIGAEFYGADFYGVAFPKLKHLELCGMKELEYWEMPFIHFSKVMPCLCEIELDECPKLRGLPALGGLESLERLETSGLDSVEHIGPEFYGVDVGTSFPQLKTFKIYEMEEWKHWEIPFSNFEKVMPCLFDLQISNCPNLMGLPDLGRLESLERMELGKLSSLTQVVAAFFRISSDCDRRRFSCPGGSLIEVAADSASARRNGELTNFASSSPNVVLFPKLRYFGLWDLSEWDEKLEETTGNTATSNMSVMLGLKELLIRSCPKLKVVSDYFFSLSLRKLVLLDCPQLMGTQPCLPPHLEELNLYGDVGVLSESLLPIITPDDDNSSSSYPYLKVVKIFGSLLSSLPQGLSRFTSLQQLQFCQCKLLDLKLKDEWRHFPMLQLLDIMACPIIKERCSREEWGNNLGHQIPFQIIIDHVMI